MSSFFLQFIEFFFSLLECYFIERIPNLLTNSKFKIHSFRILASYVWTYFMLFRICLHYLWFFKCHILNIFFCFYNKSGHKHIMIISIDFVKHVHFDGMSFEYFGHHGKVRIVVFFFYFVLSILMRNLCVIWRKKKCRKFNLEHVCLLKLNDFRMKQSHKDDENKYEWNMNEV